ncbi:MAG TPA: F0F1 ATP synthase subunit B [Candidatus Saccharimonadales bacterium]|nr:F0F1 ATP synthase subunit B [Candidatus Saccharimonadales bacterium]
MITNLTHFAAAESADGIGALGVDGKALLIQLVTFVLAYLVLRKWAFGPIMKVLNERRQTIEDGVRIGEQMKKDQAELETKVEAALSEARAKAEGIIGDANESSRQIVREAEDKARAKADGILREADDRIAGETQRARKQLQGELVSLISDATEAIIGEKVDAKKDAELIDRALKEQQA